MVSEIIISVIKNLVKNKRYRMIYNEDNNSFAGSKTLDYIRQLGVPEDVVVEKVTNSLTPASCYSVTQDDNARYINSKPGSVYVFRTKCFNEELYVKYKLLQDECVLLIFSIHPPEFAFND